MNSPNVRRIFAECSLNVRRPFGKGMESKGMESPTKGGITLGGNY